MSTTKAATPIEADAPDQHRLVAELRAAMANRDAVSIGRLLELLAAIKTELEIGEPAIDAIAAKGRKAVAAKTSAPDGKPGPATPQAARSPR